MSQQVRELEPEKLWNHFADLNEVPRPSKKEDRVIEFVRQFGQSLKLETQVDGIGNVIIRKPATAGMQDRLPVVLQSHLDMVHQKNSDTDFDFDRQGIDMYVEGDWVRARGTTLGADNGIGVASIMTVLASDDIPHPPLEALFTIDEETGMTGAMGLQGGLLQGQILLNLDTEEDNELTIGCAGGVDTTATRTWQAEACPSGQQGHRILVKGLKGGHSGVDIHLGRGNANKIMNRLLWHAATKFEARIAEIDGGGLRNAIPRESVAVIVVPHGHAAALSAWLEQAAAEICTEYRTTDPELVITCESVDAPARLLPGNLQKELLGVLYALPNGIQRLSPEIQDLVQTSNNLARVLVQDGQMTLSCLTRSSVNSERDDVANAITAAFGLLDTEIRYGGKYPGWQPVPDSTIVKLMSSLYEELFGESAHVAACHAGLECGIIGTHYPEMQMISFGPTIRGAHSPEEQVRISSVQKFWRFLRETLKRIPAA
jgi:dipeptidase D